MCKDEDEVVVRPLTYAEVRARTLMGRSQISADGRKLEDGIAFGRPALRKPVRPDVRIPPRKRKRGDDEEEEEEGEKRVRFLKNGEVEAGTAGEIESVPLGNHKTVVVVPGDGDEDEEDDEDDDEDFKLFDSDDDESGSESESESDSSDASSSSSESDSSDSSASSDSSDSSSDSPSDSESEGSRKARAKRTAPKVKPTTKPTAKPHPAKPSTTSKTRPPTTSGAQQPRVIPHEGKKETHARNVRRRDSKKLAYLKENNILPPSATLTTLRAYEEGGDWTAELQGLPKHMIATEASSSTLNGDNNGSEDVSEEVDLATRRQNLLDSIASGGVEIGVNGKSIREEDVDEGPEVQSNKTAAANAALTERLYKENIESMAGASPDESPATGRRNLDMSSAQRLLYGSLGVRTPKTQEQRDALQKKLAGRHGTAAPKGKASAKSKQPIAAEEEAEEEDPDAWLDKIDLRAVECCDEGVELSTPPYPFYQRWDPQYRKKKNRNMATYANPPRKRRRGNQNQATMVGELMESYDKYNQDGYGDVLDYDGDGGEDEYWEEGALLDDQDELAEQQLLNEVNAEAPVDDFPALPEDISKLAPLVNEDARSGDYITHTELVCSPATNWQPAMLTRTLQLLEKEDEGWKAKVAIRDLPPKEFDEDGNRVYGKFEMAEMSDDEDESDAPADERIKNVVLGELADVRLLLKAEEEEARQPEAEVDGAAVAAAVEA